METHTTSGLPADRALLAALFDYLLELGDDRLILGERLAAWCGHGPALEEDIALTNLSLDLIGQAALLFSFAGRVEGKGRTEDTLAFFRSEREFRNCLLVEEPRGDFAFTIVRQLLFSTWADLELTALATSPIAELAGIAQKAAKENRYHLRHARMWTNRLGDGTPESRARIITALDALWRFQGELYAVSPAAKLLSTEKLVPNRELLIKPFQDGLRTALTEATIPVPNFDAWMAKGGRSGNHSEHLGHLLAEMQSLPRSLPNASW